MATAQSIQQLVDEFTSILTQLIETSARAIARDAIERATSGAAFSGGARRRPPSPGRMLQGQYIGRLRKLKGADRTRVQKVAQTKGVKEAVKLADSLIARLSR